MNRNEILNLKKEAAKMSREIIESAVNSGKIDADKLFEISNKLGMKYMNGKESRYIPVQTILFKYGAVISRYLITRKGFSQDQILESLS